MRYQLNFLRFQLLLWPPILLASQKRPLLARWQSLNDHLARDPRFSMRFEDFAWFLCGDSVEREQVLRGVVCRQVHTTLVPYKHG